MRGHFADLFAFQNNLHTNKILEESHMYKMYNYILVFIALFAFTAYAQNYKVSGNVTSASTGEALVGANVFVVGTTWGAASDEIGNYSVTVEKGSYTVACSYIGYERVEKEVNVSSDMAVNFSMVEYQYTLSVTVISDRAKDRETPVAFTDVKKRDIEFTLGSRDIPLVLNSTPSIYATNYGGGAGDSRVNLRGYDQKNVAILLNGIPINDMENGWVYWSNWDGLGDATSSIQIQRGLSAISLASPSIGGTINIITDPTRHAAGVMYQNETGTGGFSKQTLFAHTGLIDDKFALSIGGVRKVGEGIVDKTWTDAWAYYFGAAYQINNNNRLELYGMGAPQQHGQRTFALNAATYSHELARDLGFSEASLKDSKLREQGILYNSNWNSVSSSYSGKQYQKSYWNSPVDFRRDPGYINERVNYFHKPLINLNWYSQLAANLNLYSSVYWSGGQGGGSGTFGSLKYNTPSLLQRVVDWDATIASNKTHLVNVDLNGDGTAEPYIISNNISGDPNRGGILRNSVNDQWTLGAISKAFLKVNKNLNLSFGADWRTAEIEHYRDVRDLLGNDFYYWDGDDFSTNNYRSLGDRIDYNNTNTVNWLGGYVQGEYTKQLYTVYANVGYSMIKFDYSDHFKRDPATGGELNLVTDWIGGYQFKGGASFRLNPEWDVFVNGGYVSKVPIFDQAIDDITGTMVEDPENEKFLSFEAGANARIVKNQLSLKVNIYFTNWTDRATDFLVTNPDGSDGLVRLGGVSERHMGAELEVGYQPIKYVRFDLAFSQGIWKYTEDVSGTYVSDFSSGASQTFNYYLKDLKVGDQPQTQGALAVTVFPIPGLQGQVSWRYYTNYYSKFDPFSRTVATDRAQVWQIPAYSLVDFHSYYTLPGQVAGIGVTVFLHVFNLLDELYVEDATDNSGFNAYTANGKNHSADDAEIYPGLPRNFNFGFRVNF